MQRSPVQVRRAQLGFTLIELLVAIAILGILAMTVITKVWSNVDESKQVSTYGKLKTVSSIVQGYRRKHNAVPDDLRVLIEPDPMNNNEAWLDEQDILDSWGRPMEIKKGNKSNEFEVISLGANGQEDGFEADFGFDRDLSSRLPLDNPTTDK